jgi:hypothetical protein
VSLNRQMEAASATAAAVTRLKEAHWDEWEAIYREERKKRGLSANVGPSALRAENMALRQRLAELEGRSATQAETWEAAARAEGQVTLDEASA